MPVDLDARVLHNARLSAEYNVLTLDAPAIASAAQPGQFVMIRTAAGLDPLLRRPFSIFETTRGADGRPAAITVLSKRVGVGTGRLYDLEPGARVGCLGPLGLPFVPVGPPSEAWMIAGGVGLAPFGLLAPALRALGTPTTLFYGARTARELFCLDVFDRLGVRVELATEDGTRGAHGRVTAPLQDALARANTDVVLYVCGPTPMMRAVAGLAARYGRRCHVSLEQVMGCGLGGCYSCVVRVRQHGGAHFVRTCVDGPVFESTAILWEELVH